MGNKPVSGNGKDAKGVKACSRQSTNRYASRPSPPYPANECCGKVKTGNDGEKYISKRAANGVCRWVKKSDAEGKKSGKKSGKKKLTIRKSRKGVTKTVEKEAKSMGKGKGKIYEIHDNGGRPFRVVVHAGKWVTIQHAVDEGKGEYAPFLTVQADEVMIGKSSPPPNRERSEPGNNMLLALPGGKLMHIGMEVREFSPVPGDRIRKFYSDVGNSDVPYAYAIGDTYIYFLDTFDKGGKVTAVERTFFRPLTEKDSYYNQYYEPFFMKQCLKGGPNHRDKCQDKKATRARIAELEKKTKRLPSKLIHKRMY
jgi:hypothetical protein